MTRLLYLMLASRWVDLLLAIVVVLLLLLVVNGVWALVYWRLHERLLTEVSEVHAQYQERLRRVTSRYQAELKHLNDDWIGNVVKILRGTDGR